MAHCPSVDGHVFSSDRNFLVYINNTMTFEPRMIVTDWRQLGGMLEPFAAPTTRTDAWRRSINLLQQSVMDWYFCFLKSHASKMEELIAAGLVKEETAPSASKSA